MYNEKLNKWGLPQEFKGLFIKPLRLLDEKKYETMQKILCYPKHIVQDRIVSKASYLNFIINVLYAFDLQENEKSTMISDLTDFLGFVTDMKCDILFEYRKQSVETMLDMKYTLLFYEIEGGEHVNEIKITENDFENIRKIVLEQNGITVKSVEEYIPALEEKLQIANKKDNMTFEEELFSLCDACGLTINEISNYTIYQFKKHFQRTQLRVEFLAFKPLEVSGQIKLKNGEIKHWLSHISDKGRYDSILISKETYQKENDIFKVSQ